MPTSASLKLINVPKKNGECPIKICIIKNRKDSYVHTKKFCRPKDWDSGKELYKNHPDKKYANEQLANVLKRAVDELEKIDLEYPDAPVSEVKKLLEAAMKEIRPVSVGDIRGKDIFEAMDEYIKHISNADTKKHYETSVAMLRKYFISLKFKDVTRAKLDEFKVWAYSDEEPTTHGTPRTKSTVRGYLRDMRRVWKWVAENENSNDENAAFMAKAYPFLNGVLPVVKRKERKKKVAFTGRVMDFLIDYDATCGQTDESAFNRQLALDTLLLQYGLLGMRIHDALTLKKNEISQDGRSLKYDMNKTGEVKHFKLPEFVIKIIERYKHIPSAYVLPYFANEWKMPNKERVAVKRDFVNRYLAIICKILGLPKITTHGARRCVGRKMIENGVNVLDIQDMYGHEELSTTLDYIASFELIDIIETDKNGTPVFGVLNEESKINSMVDVMNKRG